MNSRFLQLLVCTLVIIGSAATEAAGVESGEQQTPPPATVSLALAQPDDESARQGSRQREWVYTFTFEGVVDKSTLTWEANLPDAISWRAQATPACKAIRRTREVRHRWTCDRDPKEAKSVITLHVTGPDQSVAAGQVEWQACAGGTPCESRALQGPVAAYDPSWVRPMIGGGITWGLDDTVDFTVKDGSLLITNDSRKRAAGLVGVLFRIANVPGFANRLFGLEKPHPIHAFLSLEFAKDTENMLDGIMIGGAVDLSSYLSFVAGSSLRRGKELSPGFKRTAAELAAREQAAGNTAYSRFTFDPGRSDPDSLKLYDGFSINDPKTSKPFFPGDAIIDSYNWSFHIGFVVPVDLKQLVRPR